MTTYAKVKGMQQLRTALTSLPARLVKADLRAALRQGANVVRDEARRLVPVGDGDLRSSLKVSTSARRLEVKSKVQAGGPDAFYAQMVEYGTQAHSVSDGASVRRGRKQDQGPRHPGAAPHPYMRPALDATVDDVPRRVAAVLRQRLEARGLHLPPVPDGGDEPGAEPS